MNFCIQRLFFFSAELLRRSLTPLIPPAPASNSKILCPTDKITRFILYWSQWLRGLRHRSAADRLLRLWVRIPLGARKSVYYKCCVLSGRGLCDELMTHPEESYRLWCVVLCGLQTSWMRRSWPIRGCWAKRKINPYYIHCKFNYFLNTRFYLLLLIYYTMLAVRQIVCFQHGVNNGS